MLSTSAGIGMFLAFIGLQVRNACPEGLHSKNATQPPGGLPAFCTPAAQALPRLLFA